MQISELLEASEPSQCNPCCVDGETESLLRPLDSGRAGARMPVFLLPFLLDLPENQGM